MEDLEKVSDWNSGSSHIQALLWKWRLCLGQIFEKYLPSGYASGYASGNTFIAAGYAPGYASGNF
ncbi:hypothetical protein T08_10340 [Trichinella sp. T8]|nr:hypothetical protein T08_10340 [Trichinella sp. T8]